MSSSEIINLVRIRPRRLIEPTYTGTGGGGYRYSIAFPWGPPNVVYSLKDGEIGGFYYEYISIEQENRSNSTTVGRFNYDNATKTLYFCSSNTDTENEDVTWYAEYDILLATKEIAAKRDLVENEYYPIVLRDDEYPWRPNLLGFSDVSYEIADQAGGIIPTNSSSFDCTNADGFFDESLYDSSYSEAYVDFIRCIGEPTSDGDFEFVFRGRIKSYSQSGSRLSFTVANDNSTLDQTASVRLTGILASMFFPLTPSYYGWDSENLVNYSLDPNYEGRPAREAYGFVSSMVLPNVHYYEGATGNNKNDVFYVGINSERTKWATYGAATGGPSSTTTRTYLLTVSGLEVGEDVDLDHTNMRTITAIGSASGSPYIEHSAIGSPLASGDTVYRYPANKVFIIQDGVVRRLSPENEYTYYTEGSTGTAFYIKLMNPYVVPRAGDIVYATIKAPNSASMQQAGNFSPPYGIMTSGEYQEMLRTGITAEYLLYSFMLQIFPQFAGTDTGQLDVDTWEEFIADNRTPVSAALPFSLGDDLPTWRNVIEQLCTTALCRIFPDNEGRWTVRKIATIGTPAATITSDDIVKDSFSYQTEYRDLITTASVMYETGDINQFNQVRSGESLGRQSSSSILYKNNEHITSRQRSFRTFIKDTDDAEERALQMRHIFSDRRSITSFSTSREFDHLLPGDTVRVERKRLPGFAPSNTENSRDYVLVGISKGAKKVTLYLDDQKGIEDNSADF